MNSSFQSRGDWSSYNYLLGRDRKTAVKDGIEMNPSMTINGHPYAGKLEGKAIYEAICQSYHYSKQPSVCKA